MAERPDLAGEDRTQPFNVECSALDKDDFWGRLAHVEGLLKETQQLIEEIRLDEQNP